MLVIILILFITEKVRVDVVALGVMVSLALLGLVTPAEALSGFSSPAVITVWAVLILSAGLSRTGVAHWIGSRLFNLAGNSVTRLVIIIMTTAGLLSGFMNSIGIASLMLPVVIDISKRTKIPAYKLLMPLAFASLLGGVTTLIGTPPNILVSQALFSYGLEPFKMFDFLPTGLIALTAGILYMSFIGLKLLSRRVQIEDLKSNQTNFEEFFSLKERLFAIHVPSNSALEGKTLGQSRLGAILGINVIAVIRNGQVILAPDIKFSIQSNDRLVVGGRPDSVQQISGKHQLIVEDASLTAEWLRSEDIEVAEAAISSHSNLFGKTISEIGFRQNFGLNVLAIWRDGNPRRTNFQDLPLQLGDTFLVQGQRQKIEDLAKDANFLVSSADQADLYRLHERLVAVRIPEGSDLVGKTLSQSRLGKAYGFAVLGIVREGDTLLMPGPEEKLNSGDILLTEGKSEDLETLRGLQELEFESSINLNISELESELVGMTEAIVSPHSSLPGKTLRQIHFREKYGLNILAIWREGRAFRSFLSDLALKYGDTLLIFGLREQLKILGSDPEFLVLTEEAQEVPRRKKMPFAILIMALVLLVVILEWVPIAIAAVAGAVLMILTGCLTPDEAYRNISWKAIFLIAGMLPLGIAMEKTGTASYLAESMIRLVGGLGPVAVTAGIFLLTALTSQIMPNPAVAVLLAPIALNSAVEMGVSPYPLMMAVAVSASAAFLSPVGHPANIMVMGPGGYRFSDFTRIGVPLILILLVIMMIAIPIFWPF